MQTLNKLSTEVFCQLLEKMNGENHLKIINAPYMPLTIEKIGEANRHMANLYSLCHYYEQNGDLRQDPEMCFIVMDNPSAIDSNPENPQIFPYSFVQANRGIYEESVLFGRHSIMFGCIEKMQRKHAEFANLWLGNIKEQGFLTQ